MTGEAIIQAMIGGGLTVFVGAIIQVIRVLRTGTSASRREITGTLKAMAAQAQRQAKDAAADADFWRYYCGTYAGQLAHSGIQPNPDYPTLTPPSQRRGRDTDDDEGARPRVRPRPLPRTNRWHHEGNGDDRAEG